MTAAGAAAPVPPAVAVRGVEKSFGDLRVLRGVDLEVAPGTIVALLGSNGAGKTTLVRILATLLKPDAGTAAVHGFDVVGQAADVRESISLTGQFAAVDGMLTGRENLALVARLRHLPDPGAVADRLLDRFALTEAGGRRASTYSGGMRRRLDIAMSLIGDPPVIFLDEPTTGLDPRSRSDLWTVIREVVAGGATVLLTTQYLDEADALADRVAVLDHGRVIAEGTATELKREVGAAHVELRLPDGRAERIATDASVADVRRILADVEARQLPVESWRVATPTLDDVFLTLTGRPTAGAAADAPVLVGEAS